MNPQAKVSLEVGGRKWEKWPSIRISRSLEEMSGDFDIELTENTDDTHLGSDLMAGKACAVWIDDTIVLQGYIDNVAHRYDQGSSTLSVRGRDKTGDLVDCAASVNGPFEFTNLKLEQIVARIVQPFGIDVICIVDTGAVFPRFAIQPGEAAMETIDRLCKFRGVYAVSNGIGGIIILRPGGQRGSGRLVRGQNILSGSVTLDWSGRFSEIVVKGQAETDDFTGAEKSFQAEGRVRDSQVGRYRPKVIVSEGQGYDATNQQRAAWEVKVAAGRSHTASYTVQGWYTDAGDLWLPNQIIRVQDANCGIDRDLLIISVNYTKGDGGTTTEIGLALPEAYELLAEREPKKKDTMGGGFYEPPPQ